MFKMLKKIDKLCNFGKKVTFLSQSYYNTARPSGTQVHPRPLKVLIYITYYDTYT